MVQDCQAIQGSFYTLSSFAGARVSDPAEMDAFQDEIMANDMAENDICLEESLLEHCPQRRLPVGGICGGRFRLVSEFLELAGPVVLVRNISGLAGMHTIPASSKRRFVGGN